MTTRTRVACGLVLAAGLILPSCGCGGSEPAKAPPGAPTDTVTTPSVEMPKDSTAPPTDSAKDKKTSPPGSGK